MSRPHVLSTLVIAGAIIACALVGPAKPGEETEQASQTPTCIIRVATQIPSVMLDRQQPFNREEYEIHRHEYAELVRSDSILHAAIRNPKVSDLPILKSVGNPIFWLRHTLVVETPKNTAMIRISMPSVDDPTASTIVNAVTEAFYREYGDKSREDLAHSLETLKNIAVQKRSELREARTNLFRGQAMLKEKAAVTEDFAAEQDRVDLLVKSVARLTELIESKQIEMTAPPEIIVLQKA